MPDLLIQVFSGLLLAVVAGWITHASGRWRRTVAGGLVLLGILLLLPMVAADPVDHVPGLWVIVAGGVGVMLALTGASCLLSPSSNAGNGRGDIEQRDGGE